MSDIQIKWFRGAREVFGDGTFKYAANDYQQIYRIYGLFKETQCSPLVTILSKFKDEVTYVEAFEKVLEIAGVAPNELSWRVAHFDQEKAAVNAFKYVYCKTTNRTINYAESYHGKQKLNFPAAHLQLGTWIFQKSNGYCYGRSRL